ncbi:hypothetical protein [Olivibacter domesticus]|uniref:Secreted protein n=1 Tax=Olivibacter domesticus TaxID=407022 RepID=A0A1H7KFQ7_OLID1|nr:hypothetical protein [Olivibacter domesticus]SEK85360.1 hypothetical protein SAMN05661044_01328 [Olivibacter domesticus]
MKHRNLSMKLVTIFAAFALAGSLYGCGCDSQSPDDVEEQFDADTIDAPKEGDSTLSEKMYPMQTDSLQDSLK